MCGRRRSHDCSSYRFWFLSIASLSTESRSQVLLRSSYVDASTNEDGRANQSERQLAVLSSSKLEACVNDGSEEMDCSMKMVLTVTLEHGQLNTESAQFMVDEVKDDSDNAKKLLKPWRLSWKKTPAYWRYPIRYVQDVNNKPIETVVKTGFLGCSDNSNTNEEELTCGVAKAGGERILDSEGFCCGCDLNDRFSGLPTRGQLDCSITSVSESAHCLGFDPLWYSIFEVDPPQVFYDIEVELAKPDNPDAPWSNVTYQTTSMILNHQQPYASAEDGALNLQLVGDLATARSPYSFESRYLAVPNSPASHARVNEELPLQSAMLIDKSFFDLSGLTCNKIGVSYTAFKRQTQECESPTQSCLASQLDDLHKEDIERESRGAPPRHLVRGFCEGAVELGKSGKGRSGSTRFLACPMAQRHTTLMRLEAKAEEAMFVTNVASGKIIAAVAPAFEALTGGGDVRIGVISTGRVVAQFVVGVTNCSEQFAAGPALTVSIEPYETATQSIRLIASQTGGGDYHCWVALSNSLGQVVDSKLVKFNVSDMQVTNGAQSGEMQRPGEVLGDDSGGGGDCSDVCPGAVDVLCFIAHSCWSRVGILLLLCAIVFGGLFLCVKFSLPCRILGCLCSSLLSEPKRRRPSE